MESETGGAAAQLLRFQMVLTDGQTDRILVTKPRTRLTPGR